MTAPTLTSAIAAQFEYRRDSLTSFEVTFSSGPSPVTVTIPEGFYFVLLGTSTFDFIRATETALNDAMLSAGRTEVFSVSMQADSRVRISCTGLFSIATTDALQILGFSSWATNVNGWVADFPPKYFVTFVDRVSNGWVQKTAVSGGVTLNGRSYGVSSGIFREEDDVRFGFIPKDTVQRSLYGLNQTPWEPLPSYLMNLGAHDGLWSVRDFLAVANGRECRASLGNFQSMRTNVGTEYYDIVSIPFTEIAAPRKERLREGWDAYFYWTVRIIRTSTPVWTR